MSWRVEDVLKRLDRVVREKWALRIFQWSKGALTPHYITHELTMLDVIEILAMIEAESEIEAIVNKPKKQNGGARTPGRSRRSGARRGRRGK